VTPPGFGKTAVVADWARNAPCAGTCLDRTQTDLRRARTGGWAAGLRSPRCAWALIPAAVEISGRDDAIAVDGLVLATVIGGVAAFAPADLVVATWVQASSSTCDEDGSALLPLTTMITIGCGDVHAQGQPARGLVVLHMLFDVIVLATALSNALRAATRVRR
jgi:hypothetical protein